MNEFHDEELIRLLHRLGDVQPMPDATRQAVDRARAALVAAPVLQLPSIWRHRLKRYLAAAAVLMVVCGAGALILLRSPGSATAGFLQVRNAMAKSTALVTYRQVERVKGEPDVTTRLLIRDKGLWRAEKSDGSCYTIMDVVQHRMLYVRPLDRKAVLLKGVDFDKNCYYESITMLANNSSARSLPGKKIYGAETIGYTVTVGARQFTVWADPRTQLPVRIEVESKDEQGRNCQIVMDYFAFGQELNADLFDFSVPSSYALDKTGIDTLPARPNDSDLVLTPKVGLGPVKFGMTIAETEKSLGKPDETNELSNGQVVLRYGSRGFTIRASKTAGVVAFSCVAQAAMVTRVRDFVGQTDKGLVLGATSADIVERYGKPDSTETRQGTTYMVYGNIQAHFTLLDDRLVQMWVSQLPTK
jgi:hypothetical protein